MGQDGGEGGTTAKGDLAGMVGSFLKGRKRGLGMHKVGRPQTSQPQDQSESVCYVQRLTEHSSLAGASCPAFHLAPD